MDQRRTLEESTCDTGNRILRTNSRQWTTSTSCYQHATQTYTPSTTSGELKTIGQLNHNLQGKNTGQDPQPPTKAWSTARICSRKTIHIEWQHEQRQWQCLHNRHHRKYRNITSHTHAIQKLVSNLRTSKRQASKSPEADIAAANRTSWFHLYIINFGDKFPTPVLTAIDIQTGMAMAAVSTGKNNQFSYAQTCLQAFLLERGRTEGILQSDKEEYLIALLKATAKACVNMAVRFSPAYSSQKQRERWKVPPYTDRTNQNTERIGVARLQHTNPHRPSTCWFKVCFGLVCLCSGLIKVSVEVVLSFRVS